MNAYHKPWSCHIGLLLQARRRQHFENRQDIKKRKQQEKGQKKIRYWAQMPYYDGRENARAIFLRFQFCGAAVENLVVSNDPNGLLTGTCGKNIWWLMKRSILTHHLLSIFSQERWVAVKASVCTSLYRCLHVCANDKVNLGLPCYHCHAIRARALLNRTICMT